MSKEPWDWRGRSRRRRNEPSPDIDERNDAQESPSAASRQQEGTGQGGVASSIGEGRGEGPERTHGTDYDPRGDFSMAVVASSLPTVSFFVVDRFLGVPLLVSFWIAMMGYMLMLVLCSVRRIRLRYVIAYFVVLATTSGIEKHYFGWRYITLCVNPVHLGDMRVEFLQPKEPSGVEWRTTVELGIVPRTAAIVGEFKDIDRDPREGPVVLSINGVGVRLINDYFMGIPVHREHSLGYRRVTIPVPSGYLRHGENTVSIEVWPTEKGYDDVNFTDLHLKVRRR